MRFLCAPTRVRMTCLSAWTRAFSAHENAHAINTIHNTAPRTHEIAMPRMVFNSSSHFLHIGSTSGLTDKRPRVESGAKRVLGGGEGKLGVLARQVAHGHAERGAGGILSAHPVVERERFGKERRCRRSHAVTVGDVLAACQPGTGGKKRVPLSGYPIRKKQNEKT